jgi:hypothetical protein
MTMARANPRATPAVAIDREQPMSGSATRIVFFKLRSPKGASRFERLMGRERASVVGGLDCMSTWRLERPRDVPGQGAEAAEYVLLAEIAQVDRWDEEAGEQVERLFDKLMHLVWRPKMFVVRPIV